MPPGGRSKQLLAGGRNRQPHGARRPRRAIGAVARWWRRLGRGTHWSVAGVAVAVVLAAVVSVLVSGGGGPAQASRARQYVAFTSCLLTDDRGLSSPQAATVWAGMEQASGKTRAKVEYVPVMSGPGEGAAAPVLAGLALGHCSVVIAVGSGEVAAVRAEARRFGSVRFVVVDAPARGTNVSAVRGSATVVKSGIAALVEQAVAASG